MQPEPELIALFGSCPYASLVAEISDFAIFLIDRDGSIISWNKGAQAIFGYAPDEIIGKPIEKLFVPEDQERGVPEQELRIAGNQKRAEDVRWHLTKSGERIWANGVTIALCDSSGEVRGFAKVARDDTFRKRTEDDLRRSQERFELVARATNDTIWDWNLINGEVWWNSNLHDTFGHYPVPAEGSEAWWKEHVHPKDRERVVKSVHNALLHRGQVWSSQYRFERADGSYAEVFDRGYPVHDEAGQPVRMLGTITDISVQKQSEREREELLQRLEFERHRLVSIFQNAPGFVAVLRGSDQVFEMANPAYYQLVGHRDIIGKPLLEAMPEVAGQGFKELLDGVLHSGVPFEGHELTIELQREPGGPTEQRFVDLLYQPLIEADGSVSGVFSHGMDITEQVRARQSVEEAKRSAEEANRLKDEFLATLSHELRTPLTSILGWTDILKSERATPEEEKTALDTIQRSARAQAQLIEDILDVSRMITGKLHLEVQPVDVVGIIEEAVDTVLPAAHARDIRVLRVLEASGTFVSGDVGRLQQIIWNLLSNAIKFTPIGGRVEIQLQCVDSQAEITVRDTGMGIAPDMLPYVFDRFRQADSTSTRTHGGLGLGLSIVRHLTEMHGGSVEAYSEGLGHGATFTVKLPLALRSQGVLEELETQEPIQPEDVVTLQEEMPRLDGIHVMVVEDQEDTRLFLSLMLQKYGARVTVAASAAEAFRAFEAEAPDVLLSDIGMPDEDGYSLIKRVRALPPKQGGQTPAAALTAFARVEDRVKALRSGFQNHIPKPLNSAEVVSVVATLAGRLED